MRKRRRWIKVARASCPCFMGFIDQDLMLVKLTLAVFLLYTSGGLGFSHSSDFVFVRYQQNVKSGEIELSLTLQISDNPNIESRDQAVEVLTALMQMRRGMEGDLIPVEDVAAASFEKGSSFPLDSPVPIGGAGLEDLESGEVAEEGVAEHEVLTLRWKWMPEPNERQLTFFLRDDCQQNVVFWWAGAQAGELSADKEVPWQILLGGDESFPLGLAQVDGEGRIDGIGIRGVALLVVLLVLGFLGLRRRWARAEGQSGREE